MRHSILATFLTLGIVGGLTGGVLEMGSGTPAAFPTTEQIAEICVDATLKALDEQESQQ